MSTLRRETRDANRLDAAREHDEQAKAAKMRRAVKRHKLRMHPLTAAIKKANAEIHSRR